MAVLNEKVLRELLGDENYDELDRAARELDAQGLEPAAVVKELSKRFRKLERVVFTNAIGAAPGIYVSQPKKTRKR